MQEGSRSSGSGSGSSSSSGSGSGSDSSSESESGSSGSAPGPEGPEGQEAEAEEQQEEAVWAGGRALRLPAEACARRAVFEELVSARVWEELEPEERARLRALLPRFPREDTAEKERSVRALLSGETFHFSSPLRDFHMDLQQGNFRPDIAKMKRFLMRARRRQQRHKMRAYYAKLLPEVLISRERLLAAVKASPPGPPPRVPSLPPKYTTKSQYKPSYARAKLRYFEELSAIRSEVGGGDPPSDDENYPEGPPQQSRRQRRHLNAMQTAISSGVASTLGGADPARPPSLDCLKHILAIHRARRNRREDHPELNTQGITLEDIKQRVALGIAAKKISFSNIKTETPSQKLKRPKKEISSPKVAKVPIDMKPIIKRVKDYETPDDFKQSVVNVTIKNELDSDSDNSFVDPVDSPKAKRFKGSPIRSEIKQEFELKYPSTFSGSITLLEPQLEPKIKQEVMDSNPFCNSSMSQPVPIKLEDLDGIDMMALPVELAEEVDIEGQPHANKTEILEPPSNPLTPDTTLMETTHANFLSLVRALFPARFAHRASRHELHTRAVALMRSPIAPLNTWYNLSDDWCAELDSALEFLAGDKGPHPDDFVPYLTFIPESQLYQWIGAGRDCDAILGRLCDRWLRARSAPVAPAPRTSPPPPPPVPKASEPMPPRWATTWTVRPPTGAELAEFRAQERRRFSQSGRPFTYIQHGYRAVVGPAVRAPANRATHANLLIADRPRHVSFVALVRDAVARLPNGEGTRADIIALLRMSQWIGSCCESTLASAVSGALDRLHSVKRDSVVRYDQRTKLWIYLQRHKSEEDWERKVARSSGGSSVSSTGARAGTVVKESPPPPLTPTDVDLVNTDHEDPMNSDSDVDVDDSGHGTRLSPPPLLMPSKPPPLIKPSVQNKLQNARPLQNRSQQNKILPQLRQQPKPRPPQQKPKSSQKSPQPKQTPIATFKETAPVTTVSQVTAQQPPQHPAATVQPPRSSPLTPVAQTLLPQKPPMGKHRAMLVATKALDTGTHSAPLQPPSLLQSAPSLHTPTSLQPPTSLHIPSSPHIPSSIQVSSSILGSVLQASQASTATLQPTPHLVSTSHVLTTQHQPKLIQQTQGTRSLLLKAPSSQASLAGAVSNVLTPGLVTNAQVSMGGRRGVVRVLSPATPTSGKSLISPRALMQQGNQGITRRRLPAQSNPANTNIQMPMTSAVASTIVTPSSASLQTRTVQLAGGRTVQLAANQTVHLPGGQAVQLSTGQTLQLSSLQLQTQSVRLPSGQSVQLASSQNVQTVRAVTTGVRQPVPRLGMQTSQGNAKGTIQLGGQNVQIGGQNVQLSQMQLSQTVKLPGGQSLQLSGQTVQLPSGQSVQLSGQTVQLSGQTVQLPIGQSLQLGTQTVQLSNGQTVQLSGQTVQLPGGQTVQLSGGQTIQLSNGQTVQLAGAVQAPRSLVGAQQVIRPNTPGDNKTTQPLVAKLLTNAQGQVISVEGMVGPGRTLQLANVRTPGQKQMHTMQGVSGVRMVGGLGPRMTRPLLLTTTKPLHNIILQQGDVNAMRATSTAGAATSQTIVLSNIGGQTSSSAPTSSPPVLKLQQVNPLQQVKLTQGLKLQQTGGVGVAGVGGVRGVVMDGQQLKLVGGRHVLARLLRPTQPQ